MSNLSKSMLVAALALAAVGGGESAPSERRTPRKGSPSPTRRRDLRKPLSRPMPPESVIAANRSRVVKAQKRKSRIARAKR